MYIYTSMYISHFPGIPTYNTCIAILLLAHGGVGLYRRTPLHTLAPPRATLVQPAVESPSRTRTPALGGRYVWLHANCGKVYPVQRRAALRLGCNSGRAEGGRAVPSVSPSLRVYIRALPHLPACFSSSQCTAVAESRWLFYPLAPVCLVQRKFLFNYPRFRCHPSFPDRPGVFWTDANSTPRIHRRTQHFFTSRIGSLNYHVS